MPRAIAVAEWRETDGQFGLKGIETRYAINFQSGLRTRLLWAMRVIFRPKRFTPIIAFTIDSKFNPERRRSR